MVDDGLVVSEDVDRGLGGFIQIIISPLVHPSRPFTPTAVLGLSDDHLVKSPCRQILSPPVSRGVISLTAADHLPRDRARHLQTDAAYHRNVNQCIQSHVKSDFYVDLGIGNMQ